MRLAAWSSTPLAGAYKALQCFGTRLSRQASTTPSTVTQLRRLYVGRLKVSSVSKRSSISLLGKMTCGLLMALLYRDWIALSILISASLQRPIFSNCGACQSQKMSLLKCRLLGSTLKLVCWLSYPSLTSVVVPPPSGTRLRVATRVFSNWHPTDSSDAIRVSGSRG